ncbi:MAG TPA: uroporphyrinogen decarboxylase [Azospirillaceae bacterium]|nr:uroporphyrinogen decarboxylase [Azospirillaceae bacterium]
MTTIADKRLLRALRGETLDRPPFWLMRQAGRYLPEYKATRAQAGGFLDLCYNPELACEVTLQPIRRYGMDAAILFSDILVVPHALGQKVWFAEGEGPRLEPIRDAAGLSVLKPEHLHERAAAVYEAVRLIRAGLPSETTLIGFCGSPWTVASYMVEGMGSKEYLHAKRWAFSDPAGFMKLIDILVDASIEYLSAQVQAGAEVLQLFDSWAGALAPRQFQELVVEPTRRIVAGIKARHPDVPVIGFPRQAGFNIGSYLDRAGVDAVGLDTGVPVDWAAANLQTRMPVQGNLDPVTLVAGGEALRTATLDILKALGDGPFVFNLGHGILQQTPPENVTVLADLIRRWPELRNG